MNPPISELELFYTSRRASFRNIIKRHSLQLGRREQTLPIQLYQDGRRRVSFPRGLVLRTHFFKFLEAMQLVEAGFEYVCDIDDFKLFRKRKLLEKFKSLSVKYICSYRV